MAKTNLQFVRTALKQLGTPYVWGGSSPSSGFDCSGLIYYSLGRLGVQAPRTSQAQYAWTRRVAPGQLKPGDLVFLNFPGETSPGHVMIWLGRDTVLQAPSAGQKVQLSHFNPQKPGTNEWGAQVVGYGRIKQLSYANSPPSAITPGQASSVAHGQPTSNRGSPGSGTSSGTQGTGVSPGQIISDIPGPWQVIPPVAGAIGGAVGGITSITDAVKFLFSIRGLQTIGGGILVLMGLYLLVRQVGLAAADAVPGPIKEAANAATVAVPQARVARAATSVPRAAARPKVVHHYHPTGSPGERRRDRLAAARSRTYDPATSEIPF